MKPFWQNEYLLFLIWCFSYVGCYCTVFHVRQLSAGLTTNSVRVCSVLLKHEEEDVCVDEEY